MSQAPDPLAALGPARLLAALGDALFVLGSEGEVLYVNPEAEKLLSRPARELTGERFDDLLSDADVTALCGFTSAITSDTERNLSLLLRQPDDGCVQVQATVVRLPNIPGSARYLVSVRDVAQMQELLSETSRFAAEEAQRADVEARARDEAEERERRQVEEGQARKLESIGQLAAGVAHEINTPIQFMSDNLLFLRDALTELFACYEDCFALADPAAGHDDREIVKGVRDALAAIERDFFAEELPAAFEQTLEGARRVARIVRAMKDFAHPSNGERRPLDLAEAIDMTVTLASNEWRSLAEVTIDCDPDLPPVPCVADEFKQVLLNLLVNACHAIEDARASDPTRAGRIEISVAIAGGNAEIRISDNGVGIPEENRQKVFDPFFTTKEVGRGTGQGLSLAYTTIVRHHGGTIDIESEVGEGTTFVLGLPLERGDGPPPEAPPGR